MGSIHSYKQEKDEKVGRNKMKRTPTKTSETSKKKMKRTRTETSGLSALCQLLDIHPPQKTGNNSASKYVFDGGTKDLFKKCLNSVAKMIMPNSPEALVAEFVEEYLKNKQAHTLSSNRTANKRTYLSPFKSLPDSVKVHISKFVGLVPFIDFKTSEKIWHLVDRAVGIDLRIEYCAGARPLSYYDITMKKKIAYLKNLKAVSVCWGIDLDKFSDALSILVSAFEENKGIEKVFIKFIKEEDPEEGTEEDLEKGCGWIWKRFFGVLRERSNLKCLEISSCISNGMTGEELISACVNSKSVFEKLSFFDFKLTRRGIIEMHNLLKPEAKLREVTMMDLQIDRHYSYQDITDLSLNLVDGPLKGNETLELFEYIGFKYGGNQNLSGLFSAVNLKSLSLRNNKVGDIGVGTLVKHLKINKTLKELYLDDNDIGHAGARSLGEVLKVNSTLNVLRLSWNNDISDVGVSAIGEGLKVNTSLKRLDLIHTNISRMGAKEIGDALKFNSSLTELILDENTIGALGAKAIGGGLKVNRKLNTLELKSAEIGDVGAQTIADVLKVNKGLTKLDLSNNGISARGVSFLADALKVNKVLTWLDLSSNNIGNGGSSLGKALKFNSTLQFLDVNENSIGNTEAKWFGGALKVNRALTTLLLDNNSITSVGAKVIGESLKLNNTLTELGLSCNKISHAGAGVIGEGLKVNNSLTRLDLSDNKINHIGAEALGEALKANFSLNWLTLDGNSIGTIGAHYLAEAVKVNTGLEGLFLQDNFIEYSAKGDLEYACEVSPSALVDIFIGNFS